MSTQNKKKLSSKEKGEAIDKYLKENKIAKEEFSKKFGISLKTLYNVRNEGTTTYVINKLRKGGFDMSIIGEIQEIKGMPENSREELLKIIEEQKTTIESLNKEVGYLKEINTLLRDKIELLK